MADSSGLDTFLYVAAEEGGKAICPLSLRQKEDGCPELVSPYGFGGVISTFDADRSHQLAVEWRRFFREQGFATAYVLQHPALPLSAEVWGEDLADHHPLHLIDLTVPLDELWRRVGKTHRYEVRRCGAEPAVRVVSDKPQLKKAVEELYGQTLQRVGANRTYGFTTKTLHQLIDAPSSILLGVEQDSRPVAIAMFLHTPFAADYFLNASAAEGRKYTRLLVWTAIAMLKDLGVACLNLGGGVRPGDSLDQFKRRFGGQAVRGQALKQILDPTKYAHLCGRYAPAEPARAGFFPPYWSPDA